MTIDTHEEKSLVGFLPPFHSLADTGRLVQIAKHYREMGGNVIFFSHGGSYEYIAKDNGFEILRVYPVLSNDDIENLWNYISSPSYKNVIKSYFSFIFSKKWIENNVKNEIEAFKKTGISMLVSSFITSCSISARVVNIPYICVISESGSLCVQAPDMLENHITRFLPQSWKIQFINQFLSKNMLFVKPFNTVAKKYHISPFHCIRDVYSGDVNLETNALEFINIFPNQQQFPSKNYVGPILIKELINNNCSKDRIKQMKEEIDSHLKKPGRSILVTLGSIGNKELFLKILKTLNKTKYNIVAINVNRLEKNDIKDLNDNILITEFCPFIEKIHQKVDLSIIHGGQGTVYSAAYAGKPIIGFPLQLEQHRNLEKFIGHGSGLLASVKYFKEKQLLDAIDEIFNHYDKYLFNAQNLAKKLPLPQGDINAAGRLVEILKENNKFNKST